MELYEEILLNALQNQKAVINISFPDLSINAEKIVESASYGALVGIQKILKNDSLSDQECFRIIEEIVRIFERLGSDCGSRHDF